MNNRISFKIALVLALVVTALGSSTLKAQEWTSLSPEGSYCKFKMPGAVSDESSESDGATTYKYSSEYNGCAYLVSYTVHTVPLNNYEELAVTSLESFNETLNGKILSQEDWEIKKHIGKKATIELSELSASCQYRVVLAGQIQYQIIVVAPVGSYDSKTAGKFFKSLKLKQ